MEQYPPRVPDSRPAHQEIQCSLEPEGFLPCLQKVVTGLQPEPVESSPLPVSLRSVSVNDPKWSSQCSD